MADTFKSDRRITADEARELAATSRYEDRLVAEAFHQVRKEAGRRRYETVWPERAGLWAKDELDYVEATLVSAGYDVLRMPHGAIRISWKAKLPAARPEGWSDFPVDPNSGRMLCLAGKPMPRNAPGWWAHPDAVNDGRDHDTYEQYHCPHCGTDFRVELPDY